MSTKLQTPAGNSMAGSPLSRAVSVIRTMTLVAIVVATLLLGQWLLS